MVKVVLFGPESTGKTTLAKQLANYYQTVFSPEFVRFYADTQRDVLRLNDSQILTAQDVESIAIGQLSFEQAFEQQANRLLILDTNLLSTSIYAQEIYQIAPEWLERAIEQQNYDFYLLLSPTTPWEADWQREGEAARDRYYSIFRSRLIEQKLPFVEIEQTGTLRIQEAIHAIDHFLGQDTHKIT